MHDKTLFLFNPGTELKMAQNTEIASRVLDFRYNGDDPDGGYHVNARLGTKPSSGTATLTLETSYDGTAWTPLQTVSLGKDAPAHAGRLPAGMRRYLRAKLKVTAALNADNTAFAEVTDSVEHGLDGRLLQGCPPEDVAKAGDGVTAAG